MYTIQYMASHDGCSLNPETGEGDCWCSKKGFATYAEAAIYAYDNMMCSGCLSTIEDIIHGFAIDEDELETIEYIQNNKHDKSMLWAGSSCSSEYWIIEDCG